MARVGQESATAVRKRFLVYVSLQCAKVRLHFPRIGLKVAAQPLLFGPASKRITNKTKDRPVQSVVVEFVSMVGNRAWLVQALYRGRGSAVRTDLRRGHVMQPSTVQVSSLTKLRRLPKRLNPGQQPAGKPLGWPAACFAPGPTCQCTLHRPCSNR